MVNPIPENYPRVSPYLSVQGGKDAIAFYSEVFGATLRGDEAMTAPDGSIAHAELEIGGSLIMLADENPEFGNKSPKTVGGTPVTMMIYVEDVDATVKLAVEKGSTVVQEPKDEFYGDRIGLITDPFGHAWHIGSHVEDVSDEEMKKRAAELFGG